MELLYFDLDHAIKEHDFIIDRSGGRQGVNNVGLLDSVINHVKSEWYYPEIEDKATYLCFSIIKNHSFTDGNKRSAIVLTSYFLELNGLHFCTTRFIREMENYAVYVAANFISQELLHKIISSIIYDYDYNEELKLEIATSLANNLPMDPKVDHILDDEF